MTDRKNINPASRVKRAPKLIQPSETILSQLNTVDKWYRDGNKLAAGECYRIAKNLVKAYERDWKEVQTELFTSSPD